MLRRRHTWALQRGYMKITIEKSYKSIPAKIEFSLPDFCVITGRNGSGKSHLLEALSNSGTSIIVDNGIVLHRAQLMPFNGLSPQINDKCDPRQILANHRNWWGQISGVQAAVQQLLSEGVPLDSALGRLPGQLGEKYKTVSQVIQDLTQKCGKLLMDLTEDDVYMNLSISASPGQGIFFAQLAEIFKAYKDRYEYNDFLDFCNRKHGTSHYILSDEEFFHRFGPKPWILVNEILKRAGLSYSVNNPELVGKDSSFALRLIDEVTGAEISVNDLSTGEKVLMSMALAIYNASDGGTKPDILMLDEPDAPLHPQFSKLLIETLMETIVERAGVKVILTTHSPSTVAMCPEGTVFEINRVSKLPIGIPVAQAIAVLTEGIPHLRVSVEDRRQIFVEGKYDVVYYGRIFALLKRVANIELNPVFLEPGTSSSNCDDVIKVVGALHGAGNDLVRGIVDWDGRHTESHPIYVLGGGARYAIENYILDPIYIAVSLVRLGKRKYSEFGIIGFDVNTEYPATKGFQQSQIQGLVDFILDSLGIEKTDLLCANLLNGMQIEYPREFLLMNGHDYEELLKRKIPAINLLAKNNNDSGIKIGVLDTISHFPEFLCIDLLKTLKAIH
jgi:predicted ATPase